MCNRQDSMITKARELAAQCWCDEETKHIEMDVRLAEAFAKRLEPLLREIKESKQAIDYLTSLQL